MRKFGRAATVLAVASLLAGAGTVLSPASEAQAATFEYRGCKANGKKPALSARVEFVSMCDFVRAQANGRDVTTKRTFSV